MLQKLEKILDSDLYIKFIIYMYTSVTSKVVVKFMANSRSRVTNLHCVRKYFKRIKPHYIRMGKSNNGW